MVFWDNRVLQAVDIEVSRFSMLCCFEICDDNGCLIS